MNKHTKQMESWEGKVGKEYTERLDMTTAELDKLLMQQLGITRSEMNLEFLDGLDRSTRILEVGSNIGNQLLALQNMGFRYLYGIDVLSYAVELAKTRTKGINTIQGSAFDIPFKDGFFDLVFTSGVLVHIAPPDIEIVLREIHRCTKKYIWGYEFFADTYTSIVWRGHKELLWKTDFAKSYLDTFDDLRLVKQKKYKHLEGDNVDTMFLLEK